MSKYNTKREPVVKRTTTHEGGSGYTQRPEHELIGILSTGIDNTYYEKESERETRLKAVMEKLSKKNIEFLAKALVYARNVFGQRTVTHVGTVNLLPYLSGTELGKRYLSKRDRKGNKGGIIRRLDDMHEILACYFAKNGEKASIPNSIKRGFRSVIEEADAYELAKYQMKNKSVSLVDIVNLVHPKNTPRNGTIKVPKETYLKAIEGTKFVNDVTEEIVENDKTYVIVPTLRALVLGLLKQFDTVEDKNTETGKKVAEKVKSGEITKEKAEEVLKEEKTENYSELIKTKKIGYLALLRNLRNILKTGNVELLDEACKLLVNREFIRRSLVWPHQIDIALEILLPEFSGSNMIKVSKALGDAYENSVPNIGELFPEGKTAVVFDTSGSMQGTWAGYVNINGKKINKKPIEKAALVAATLSKGTGADVYHFGTECKAVRSYNPSDSINTIKKGFEGHIGLAGHGTYMHTIFPTLDREGGRYDRVFIITDEQSHNSVETVYRDYLRKYGTPHVYFINIVGYGPTVLKQDTRVHRIHGYSPDIYESAKRVEIDPNEIIKEINKIII